MTPKRLRDQSTAESLRIYIEELERRLLLEMEAGPPSKVCIICCPTSTMAEQMKRSKAAVRNRARRLKIVVAKSRLGLKAKGK
jgi:hypothetical protein